MKKVWQGIAFLDKHKGTALFLGGLMSTTAGATWWLAKGGAAAFISSMLTLADPDISRTLSDLPDYHKRVESQLVLIEKAQRTNAEALQHIADSLEAYRTETQQIVDWAREHSQRLTDAVGGCYADSSCLVYFRGRRTQAGAGCTLTAARPRLVMPDGREFPVDFSEGNSPAQLGTDFQTIPVKIDIPAFIEPGHVGILVLLFYAECPFATPGAIVERETFRLLVEIKPRD